MNTKTSVTGPSVSLNPSQSPGEPDPGNSALADATKIDPEIAFLRRVLVARGEAPERIEEIVAAVESGQMPNPDESRKKFAAAQVDHAILLEEMSQRQLALFVAAIRRPDLTWPEMFFLLARIAEHQATLEKCRRVSEKNRKKNPPAGTKA